MPHVASLAEATLSQNSYVAVGVFDGVHRGHQVLLRELAAAAHTAGCAAVVVTFYPHPAEVLRGRQPSFYLNRPEEKAALLLDLGVDWVVTHPFSVEVSRIPAAGFVDLLLEHLRMRALWAGPDFALGHKRQGTVPYLQEQGQAKGFRVRVVEPYRNGETVISSSLIRAALREGQVELAAEYLGRPYSLAGRVIEGAHRGRSIGVPTANLEIWPDQVYPALGVYACWATVDGARRAAATNIGVRPTFEQTGLPTIEAHLLDFDGDLYGREVRLEFVRRLRPEKKFDGVEALVAQIKADVAQARALLAVDA